MTHDAPGKPTKGAADCVNSQYENGKMGMCPHCGQETLFSEARQFDKQRARLASIATSIDPIGGFPQESKYEKSFDGVELVSESQTVTLQASECYKCHGIIIWGRGIATPSSNALPFRVWPLGAQRAVPSEVPEHIATIYKRASRQLDFDNVACAAFARTCLEKVLDDRKVPTARNLEIRLKKFLDTTRLPDELAKNVDVIREMGNFIHLNESKFTEQAIDITPVEAEWVLNMLDDLFEELYVRPKRQAQMRDAFKAKVEETKRPKSPSGTTKPSN